MEMNCDDLSKVSFEDVLTLASTLDSDKLKIEIYEAFIKVQIEKCRRIELYGSPDIPVSYEGQHTIGSVTDIDTSSPESVNKFLSNLTTMQESIAKRRTLDDLAIPIQEYGHHDTTMKYDVVRRDSV